MSTYTPMQNGGGPRFQCLGIQGYSSRTPFAHHSAKIVWPSCWKCQRRLGCKKCGASTVLEVYCWVCHAWGTPLALRWHGPMQHGPNVDAYPMAFRSAYDQGEFTAAPDQEVYDPEFLPALRHRDRVYAQQRAALKARGEL